MPFRILFVCTGNSCRSPLAEILARRLLDRAAPGGFAVSSAGTNADAGGRASDGARLVAGENGLELERFRSGRLTPELLEAADLVLVMEPAHRSKVLSIQPLADTKTMLLGELSGANGPDAAVADPFGGPPAAYRTTFDRLETLLEDGLPRLMELARRKAER